MGIFYEQVQVVNRTSEALGVRYDGQDIILAPNYDKDGKRIAGIVNMIPKVAVPYALNQNVVMGSEDALDPSSFRSKVGIVDAKEKSKKSWHEVSYIADEAQTIETMTRVNLKEYLEDDPQVKDVIIRGRKTDAVVKLPSMDNGGVMPVRGRG